MKLIMAFVIVLATTPCYAAATSVLTLYDNFSGNYINPTLWVGEETESDTSNRVLREDVRQIESKRLHLKACAWGCTQCGSTNTHQGENRLNATGLQNATALQAGVMVNNVAVEGGSGNSNPAVAKARLFMFLFNNGQSTGPDDETGDVFAYIDAERWSNSTDAANVLDVLGRVLICTDATCSSNTVLEETNTLGTLKVGTIATFYMEWTKAKHQILFRNTISGKSTSQTLNYGSFKTVNAPSHYIRRIDVQCRVADSTASQSSSLMDAYFYNVLYK